MKIDVEIATIMHVIAEWQMIKAEVVLKAHSFQPLNFEVEETEAQTGLWTHVAEWLLEPLHCYFYNISHPWFWNSHISQYYSSTSLITALSVTILDLGPADLELESQIMHISLRKSLDLSLV